MLEIAIYLVVLIVLIFALVKLIDKFVTPGNKKIFTAVLWGISLFLVYLIYSSIMKPIEFQNEKEARYEVAVKTMLDIKKLQTGYKSVHGKYADTFDELVKFVETGEFANVGVGAFINGGRAGFFEQNLGQGLAPEFGTRRQRLEDKRLAIAVNDQAGEPVRFGVDQAEGETLRPHPRPLSRGERGESEGCPQRQS